ncbi:MAG: Na(+)-translocating NADH-quinone reductase subunit A [Acidobacteria bacterium]|nr:Na(+)-translocating NADH-quinone reductase subunit A [Acidobacteriota bacterium]
MGVHRNRKGLDLPITGQPEPVVEEAGQPRRIALLADDYVGMKPTMHVRPGDAVSRGQLLFECKKTIGVRYTSPADGKVVAVNRGDKRNFESVVVELSASEMSGGTGAETSFASYAGRDAAGLSREQVRDLLIESGEWTALRARPFGRVADPDTTPKSIFVTAMDSNPLAPDVAAIVADRPAEFEAGLAALAQLTEGIVYVCAGADAKVSVPSHERVRVEQFKGQHPSGTPGWHIHTLDPVDRNKLVWHLGAQDVIAIGHLFRTGKLMVERVIALAGPSVTRPRLLRTRRGAALDDLVSGETADGKKRVISGSVFGGTTSMGEVHGFLHRYDQQVTVLKEGDERVFLGWMGPGFGAFSVTSAFASKLMPGKKFPFTTTTHGSHRAIVPIGSYEKVFPFDIPPSFLMRALAVHDVERAEQLGCLELTEEDLALCTFVEPGKEEYGPRLRAVLETIWKEG